MPKKKTTEKAEKKEFEICPNCKQPFGKGAALREHKKSCNKKYGIEAPLKSSEIAKRITPELQEKMEHATSPLAVVENRIRQAQEGGVPISQEDQQVIKEVLKLVQAQKMDQQEIDSNLQQAEKIRSKSKIVQAAQDFESLKPGDKVGLQEAMAFSTIMNAQSQQQAAQQTQQLNQLYIQERMRKMDQPKETSNKFQEQLLLTLIKDMNQAKAENDIEKFSKSYEAIKKMTELIGEKDTGTAGVLGELAKQIVPPLMDLGKEVMKKKQNQPDFLAPNPPVPSSNPGPAPKTEGFEPSPHNNLDLAGEPPVVVAPPQENPELTDEEYLKKYGSELEEYGYDNSDSPFLPMYHKINSNTQVKSEKS